MKNTKIELADLFKDKWDSAYLVYHSKEKRRYVIMRNSKTDKRTSMQHGRYLMCVNLGRILGKNEQVDHIDGNSLNDSLDNLQILTIAEHTKKSVGELEKRVQHARLARVPRHGTYWEYRKYGCRCDACIAAMKEYSRQRIKFKKKK